MEQEIQWTIESLEAGSALATAQGISDDAFAVETVVRAFLSVGQAEETDALLPFSPKVKQAADRIASIPNSHVSAVRFETAEGEATIYGHDQKKPTTRLIRGFGAVTGRVQTLSNRGALRFTLFDLLSDRAVSCYVDPEREEVLRGVWGKPSRSSKAG